MKPRTQVRRTTDGTPHRGHHREGEEQNHQYNVDHDKNHQNDQFQFLRLEDQSDPYQYYRLAEKKNYKLRNRDDQSQC